MIYKYEVDWNRTFIDTKAKQEFNTIKEAALCANSFCKKFKGDKKESLHISENYYTDHGSPSSDPPAVVWSEPIHGEEGLSVLSGKTKHSAIRLRYNGENIAYVDYVKMCDDRIAKF